MGINTTVAYAAYIANSAPYWKPFLSCPAVSLRLLGCVVTLRVSMINTSRMNWLSVLVDMACRSVTSSHGEWPRSTARFDKPTPAPVSCALLGFSRSQSYDERISQSCRRQPTLGRATRAIHVTVRGLGRRVVQNTKNSNTNDCRHHLSSPSAPRRQSQ